MRKSVFLSDSFKVLTSVSIGFILFVTAITKIIYPSPLLLDFYIALGIFEIILAGYLIIFSEKWQAWAFLALVFAAWGGYSFYSTLFGLPCPCLGAAIEVPRGATLAVDGMILTPAWVFLMKDKRVTDSLVKTMVVLSALFFILGFLFPEIIYNIE